MKFINTIEDFSNYTKYLSTLIPTNIHPRLTGCRARELTEL